MRLVIKALASIMVLSAALLSPVVMADWAVNMPKGVTDISHKVYDMHMLAFWIMCVVAFGVFGAMTYSIIKHRKSKGVTPATFHESTAVEVVWTIIPFIILIVLALPAARTLIAQEDDSNSELTIKITGYQWKWQYEYPDSGVSFFSALAEESRQARVMGSGIDVNDVEHYLLDVDKPLVIPVDTKVRFLLTANDVIHSWWVPDFAIKKDAIPGFINTMWTHVNETGTYRGQCTELCGRDHGFMPVVVEVVEKSEFNQWLASQVEAKESGQQLAATN
ncbi:MAG: cytochrome c oxidase subunit II [Acidiferrobacterales bacterium]|nr:cytochrome c oxidase subunit II [Acidiferrobacterales bacterium]